MKHLRIILYSAAVFLAVACGEQSPFAVRDEAAVFIDGSTDLFFSKTGEPESESTSFSVSCNYDWVAYPNADWIEVSPTSGKADVPTEVSVSVTKINDGEIRSAQVNFFDKDMLTKSSVTVTQNGSYFIVDATELNAGFMDNSISFDIRANTRWSLECLTDGFTSTTTGGDGDATVTINFSANDGEAAREGLVLVSTEADLKVKRYLVKITQDFGLILKMHDWSRANMQGSTKAAEGALIRYAGTDADYTVPEAKGKRQVLDTLQYGRYKPVNVWGGWPEDSSNPGSYFFTDDGIRLNYGSSSSNPCAWIRLPEYEGYRPLRIDVKVYDTRSYKICVPAADVNDPTKAAWSKFSVIGSEKKSSVKGTVLSWDISAKSQTGIEYYIVAKNTQSVIQDIDIYYEKIAQ